MKRQRAEISSNVISHIKSAHPIEMWRSNKLGIKEKVSRGNFPRLIFSCPVPSGLPHRSHCVPMNMNPYGFKVFTWRGREDLNLRGAFYTPYSLSRGAPSASWVLPQVDGKIQLAERVGFEPTDAFTSPVFKTGAFNRSAISPDNEFTSNSQTQE